MMDSREYFSHLMDVIDNWMEEGEGNAAGPFRFLRDEAAVKSIAVTPNCSIHAAQLKTYLATEILGIYRWNTRSKVSYRDIQKSLAGEASKKYVFHFDELDNCLSIEANRDAARRSKMLKGCGELAEALEGEGYTLYLLERLQKMARIKLGEYWCMCAPDYDMALVKMGKRIKWKPKKKKDFAEEKLPEEEFMEQKQNKYMECLMAVALHEIFTREHEQYVRNMEAETGRMRKKLLLLKQNISEALGKMSEGKFTYGYMETEELTEQSQELVLHIPKYMKLLKTYAVGEGVRMEHMVGVAAQLQLVMFLETKNLEMMGWDNGMGRHLTEYLECLEDRAIDGFVRYDKNRNKYYRMLRENMDDIFFRFMKDSPWPDREAVSEAVDTYFSIVEGMKLYESEKEEKKQQTRLEELWKAQIVLVKPIWRWEEKDGDDSPGQAGRDNLRRKT